MYTSTQFSLFNFGTGNSILFRGGETVAVFNSRASRSVFARIVHIFLPPSSAFESRLVGKTVVSCLQISLLSADYRDVILKLVVKPALVSVPRNNKI